SQWPETVLLGSECGRSLGRTPVSCYPARRVQKLEKVGGVVDCSRNRKVRKATLDHVVRPQGNRRIRVVDRAVEGVWDRRDGAVHECRYDREVACKGDDSRG